MSQLNDESTTDVIIDGKEVGNPPTAAQILAQTIRDELEVRVVAWRAERAQLLLAAGRIAVLDGLIALAEDQNITSLAVAPRPPEQPSP